MSTKTEVEEKEQMKEEAKDVKAEEKHHAKKSGDLAGKLQKILESIEQLTVLELAQLVKALEEKFGVSAQAAVAVQAPGAAQAGAGAPAGEEKTAFQVILANAGEKKIQVIKEIRAVTNLGLKEAKDLVESAPKPIKDNASKEEANKIKATLEAVGAKVEIK